MRTRVSDTGKGIAIAARAIEATALSKTYEGGVRAVDGLDMAVEKNTVYALLGPNGAGKTTIISILTTLLSPTGSTDSLPTSAGAGQMSCSRLLSSLIRRTASARPIPAA